MKAKVIKKPKGREKYFGRVGEVEAKEESLGFITITLRFNDDDVESFRPDELRMGVKASG